MSSPNGSTPTLVEAPISSASALRKYTLLAIFSLAQFLDAFNNSALFSGIPAIAADLKMDASETVWIISAYQLTFAAFLLVAGRISDIYSPKPTFIIGSAVLGFISLGAGFSKSKIGLLVLRAISGMGASLTIPSALNLLVHLFPLPGEQGRAIAIFGGSGAIGNVLGLLIGALFIQYTSWPWIFWFLALIAVPIALACIFLIPATPKVEGKVRTAAGLDIPGVSLLTAALILFIFAVTSGSTAGWSSAYVLSPLIISLFLLAGFFYWETKIDEANASLPPKMWFYPNFAVLFATALLPFFWWVSVFVQFTSLWQEIYHWSAISTAVHFLPLGIIAGVVTVFAGSLPRFAHPKWIILTGEILTLIATVLLPFADRPSRYWPFLFPAFSIGTFGNTLVFTNTNIAIFRTTPPEVAGTVGAVVNAALQLGSAVGIAAVTSIQTSIDGPAGHSTGKSEYAGRAASFWFLFAIVAVEAISVAIFFRTDADLRQPSGEEDSVEVITVQVDEKAKRASQVSIA